nr:MAG TPA: Putative virion structural protein [Caudoviricetes sp.]
MLDSKTNTTDQLFWEAVKKSTKTYSKPPSIFEVKDIRTTDEGFFNTKATVVFKAPYTIPDLHVAYDRMNIESYFRGIHVVVKYGYQRRISDFLPYIASEYGLSLNASDIEDGVLPNGVKTPFRFTMSMSNTNPAFYGNLVITVIDDVSTDGEQFRTSEFSGVKYYKPEDKINAEMYFYGRNWTKHRAFLADLTQGANVSNTFVDFINSVDVNHWCISDTPQPFNFYKAKVLYRGRIDEQTEYTRKVGLTHVCVVALDEHYCTNFNGYLLFHYSEDFMIS